MQQFGSKHGGKMSQAGNCDCPCPDPTITEIPGAPGENGAAGAAGSNGINAFTVTTADITLPASAGPVVLPTTVGVSSWAGIGQVIFISDGTNWGHFEVLTIPSAASFTLEWLQYPGDAVGTTVIATGATVSPSGEIPQFSPPTSLTVPSGLTASDIIADGIGQYTHSIYFRAAAITGNVLLYTYTPAFAFRIIRISASVVDAITTGARAATLTTAIGGTPTTGGVVVVSGTYALGAEQASSAAVSGANDGTSIQAITITASSVTAFAEGGFVLNIQMQNLDSANAIASLADHINDLITALT